MGKVIERVRMWNMLDEKKVKTGEIQPIEVEVVIDSGATTSVLPSELSARLGLELTKPMIVEYADGRKARKEAAVGLRVEALGRDTILRVVLEPGRKTPLLGQLFLEDTCLLVDCKNQRLVPDPTHGGEQVHEIWSACAITTAARRRGAPRWKSQAR